MRELTQKEQSAVLAYVGGKSKSDAYRVAYDVDESTCKPESVNTMAFAMFKRPPVVAEVGRFQSEARNALKTTTEAVINKWWEMAQVQITDMVTVEEGKVIIRDTTELSDQQIACIESIKETKAGVEVKFFSKIKALESIAKHLGMFSERHILEMGSTFDLTVNLDRYAAPMEPEEVVGDDVQGGSGPDE